MIKKLNLTKYEEGISNLEKTKLLIEASNSLGLHTSFEHDGNTNNVIYTIKNCPFKELLTEDNRLICDLHNEFLNGMFKELFLEIEFKEITNIFDGCKICSYNVKI